MRGLELAKVSWSVAHLEPCNRLLECGIEGEDGTEDLREDDDAEACRGDAVIETPSDEIANVTS